MTRRQGVRGFAVFRDRIGGCLYRCADPAPSTSVTELATEQDVTSTRSDPAYPQLVNFATIYGEGSAVVGD
jgi:hypothetical protein